MLVDVDLGGGVRSCGSQQGPVPSCSAAAASKLRAGEPQPYPSPDCLVLMLYNP